MLLIGVALRLICKISNIRLETHVEERVRQEGVIYCYEERWGELQLAQG
jgi:hypothetical protein